MQHMGRTHKVQATRLIPADAAVGPDSPGSGAKADTWTAKQLGPTSERTTARLAAIVRRQRMGRTYWGAATRLSPVDAAVGPDSPGSGTKADMRTTQRMGLTLGSHAARLAAIV